MTQYTPRIIHQVWFNFTPDDPSGDNVPSNLRPMQQSWIDHHPEWKYVLWSRPKADEFIARHYAWFLPTWQSYKSDIYRVDAIRYFILFHFGGVYVDMDAVCHQSVNALRMHPVVLVGTPHTKLWLSNYFMMAHRRHPFFQYCVEHLTNMAESGLHWANSFFSTMTMAGPAYLTWSYVKFKGANNNDITNAVESANSGNNNGNNRGPGSPVHADEIHVLHHCYFGAGRDDCNVMLHERGERPFADHQFHSSWNAKRRAWADVVRLLAVLLGLVIISVTLHMFRRRQSPQPHASRLAPSHPLSNSS